MKSKNIYICGVGGQGIGMLSNVLTKACLMAGYKVMGCDTHGLAQRHGTVVSHLRIGQALFTPRVPPGEADVVVGLERLEALRAAVNQLKNSGAVVYYDSVYQPIHVRSGLGPYPKAEALEEAVTQKKGTLARVYLEDLDDPRMQNVALLGRIAAMEVIEGVTVEIVEEALREIVPPKVLEKNLEVFKTASSTG